MTIPSDRRPGLDPGPVLFSSDAMDWLTRGGWVYIMTNRYRGALYVGMTSSLAHRIAQHRSGAGSDYCARRGLTRLVWAEQIEPIDMCIAHEKRLKRWHRDWKFALIERANLDWDDLSYDLI